MPALMLWIFVMSTWFSGFESSRSDDDFRE